MRLYQKTDFIIKILSAWSQLREEIRTTLMLALPLFGGQLSAVGSALISLILAGRLGSHVLAPIALGSSIWMLAVIFLNEAMMALRVSVAQLDGAGRRAEAGPIFIQTLWLNIMLNTVLIATEYFFGPVLTQKIAATPKLANDTSAFLHTICIAGPALGIFSACRGLSEGLSMARPTLGFIILGLMLTGPISYVLMYGALGFPALGAVGSGIASVIASWIQALAFLFYVCRSHHYRELRDQIASIMPNWKDMFDLLKFGLSIGMTRLLEGGLFIASALVVGRVSTEAVANHQIAINIESIVCTVSFGLSTAITVRVAHAKGRNNLTDVWRAGFIGIAMTLSTQLLCGGLILLMPSTIVSLYTHDPGSIASAVILIQFVCLMQISDGLQSACYGALRGLKDTRVPIVITFLAYWAVGMPIGWWLSITRNWGVVGMWIGLIIGLSLAAGLLFARFCWISSSSQLKPSNVSNSPMLLPSEN